MVSHLQLCQRALVSALLAVAAVLKRRAKSLTEMQTHHACVQRMAQFYAKHGAAPMVRP